MVFSMGIGALAARLLLAQSLPDESAAAGPIPSWEYFLANSTSSLPARGSFDCDLELGAALDRRRPGIVDDVWTVGRQAAFDAAYLATSPWRWTEDDLVTLGAGLVILGGVMLLDEDIKDYTRRHDTQDLRRLAGRFDKLAESNVPYGLGSGITAIGLLAGDERMQRTGLEIIESATAMRLLTNLGKRVFGRSRPFTGKDPQHWSFFGGRDDGMRSFPSGHASLAYGMAAAIGEEYPDTAWSYAAYGLATTVAWARIELNAHWASDTAASLLLSIAVAKTLVWLHRQDGFPPLVPWIAGVEGSNVVGAQIAIRFRHGRATPREARIATMSDEAEFSVRFRAPSSRT